MLINKLTLHIPKTLSEALSLYNELENIKIQAGGTFLLNTLKLQKKKGTKTPENILSLYKINELKGIETQKDKFVIKSMTTINDILESNDLIENLAILKTVCQNISTQPIRNMATIGGNLTCRYTWTEMPAVMIALNATMHFLGSDSKTDEISAEDFFKAAAKTDKILTHISIPRNKNIINAYYRAKKTQFVDIPMLSICISTIKENDTLKNTRIGVNNCVGFAKRDSVLEEYLNSNPISEKTATDALKHLDEEIYDTRSSQYKKSIFRVAIKHILLDLIKA